MKLLKVLFLFLILVSCKKEQELTVPDCFLSEAEMVDVMVDVSLIKSAKSQGRKGLKDSGIKPLEYLFAKHGVDTIIIRENLEYYNADLNRSKDLNSKVVEIIKKRKEILKQYVDSLPSAEDKEEKLLEEEETDSLSSSKKNEKDDIVSKEAVEESVNEDSKKKKRKIAPKKIDSLSDAKIKTIKENSKKKIDTLSIKNSKNKNQKEEVLEEDSNED